MSIIKSLFKQGGEAGKQTAVGEAVSMQTLKRLIPIRNLSDEKLQAFAMEASTELHPKGSVLFSIDTPANSALYILEGAVNISDRNGKGFAVDSSHTKARFPLCSGDIHTTTAKADTDVTILRVSNRIMSINTELSHDEIKIPDSLKHNHILQMFAQFFMEEELEIPSMPKIANDLRKAMEHDIGIADAVKIIQLDPVISAKLIEVANCPLYLTLTPAKTCHEAVNRIGLNATRALVISFSLKQIFTSNQKSINKLMDVLWKSSINLSAVCFALASASDYKDPEEALLAGLISDIGAVPFLSFVSNLPAEFLNMEEVVQALPAVKGIIGASVLKNWSFAEEFIDVALHSEEWYQNLHSELSLTDLVVLSRLHCKITQKSAHHFPAITSIPAAGKLTNIALSPENSLHILHEARHKINEALKVLT